MASIADALKKATQQAGGNTPAPTVTVADTSSLTANSSSGTAEVTADVSCKGNTATIK
jgi:hypothetical protein